MSVRSLQTARLQGNGGTDRLFAGFAQKGFDLTRTYGGRILVELWAHLTEVIFHRYFQDERVIAENRGKYKGKQDLDGYSH